MTNSESVPVILPHHQAAPALPLDQSCLPEESASATRAHGGSSPSSSSHHSSSAFSNTTPVFEESVFDSVSATATGLDPGCPHPSPQSMSSLAVTSGTAAKQTGLHPVRALQRRRTRGLLSHAHPCTFQLVKGSSRICVALDSFNLTPNIRAARQHFSQTPILPSAIPAVLFLHVHGLSGH